jgi:hypothetical protein
MSATWSVLSVFGLLLGASCGPSSHHSETRKSPPLVTAAPAPTITINASYPAEPPDVFVSLSVSDSERTPTTLVAEKLVLVAAAGSPPLVTIHGRLDPGNFDFASGPFASTYFLDPTELNRDLGAACSATAMELHLTGSACACPIVVESAVRIQCLLDARAGDLLTDPGLAAPAGKPCAMRQYLVSGGIESLDEEHRYGYDAGGHLRFLDVYDEAGTFTERQVFTYETSSYLHQVDTIQPQTGLINSRKTYFYGADGLLARVEFDGDLAIDGIADWTSTFTIGTTTWQEQLVYADTSLGTRSSTYAYDATNCTLTEEGTVLQLRGPLTSPNQILAMPGEVEQPAIVSGTGTTYTYATNEQLTRIDVLGMLHQDYLYSCP